MSTLKVNAIRGTGASSDAISVNSTDGTCTAKITNNLSNRNLIINGAMNVAQRGTSETSVSGVQGYTTCDRWKISWAGANNIIETHQSDVASGTDPYVLGFRKAFKLVNGDQSSGAGAGDKVKIEYIPEAQDIATSGWNYVSTSSYLTMTFWLKSSVAQTFYVIFESKDGTSKQYSFAATISSAGTWTKITKTIPGHADLSFNNDNGEGFSIYIVPFTGTTETTSGHTLNSWKNTSGSDQAPDMTSTWWTTNDATFEITGVQLEVGDVATDFEHRSFTDELLRCQRYYWSAPFGGDSDIYLYGGMYTTGSSMILYELPVKMRITPTLTYDEIRSGTSSISNYTTQYQLSHHQLGVDNGYIKNAKLNAEL